MIDETAEPIRIEIPAHVLDEAGLKPDDPLEVRAYGDGRILIYHEDDVISKYSGIMRGVYEPGFLDKLRDKWDR